jgi:1,4-dihydroxy-2-naphthoyl-CoA hydrolase
MQIWQKPISVEILQSISQHSAVTHLGIEYLEVGDDSITGRVPVDHRTQQYSGILHGGVSVVLAETLGSCGAGFSCHPDQVVVGLEINANHIKAAHHGWVTGVAKPIHRGRTTHIWGVELRNDERELVCISRITLALLTPR